MTKRLTSGPGRTWPLLILLPYPLQISLPLPACRTPHKLVMPRAMHPFHAQKLGVHPVRVNAQAKNTNETQVLFRTITIHQATAPGPTSIAVRCRSALCILPLAPLIVLPVIAALAALTERRHAFRLVGGRRNAADRTARRPCAAAAVGRGACSCSRPPRRRGSLVVPPAAPTCWAPGCTSTSSIANVLVHTVINHYVAYAAG